MKSGMNKSLLHNLEESEILQIIQDYESYKTTKFLVCVDAHDILEYVDPFMLLYGKKRHDEDFGILSDKYYAFDSLSRRKGGVILLNEYKLEIKNHQRKFNDYGGISKIVFDRIIAEDFNLTEDSETLILENLSSIFFVLSKYPVSIRESLALC